MSGNNGWQKFAATRQEEMKDSFSYTNEKREALQRGLRILARLIARTHRRQQPSNHQAEAANKGKDRVP